MKFQQITIGFLLIIVFIFCFNSSGFSQETENHKRKVEVVGSAELEIVPDEIFLSISLREYKKDAKNKVNIEALEKDLNNAVAKAGIPKENFEIENIYGYNWVWDKKKDEEFMARKRYRLKLNDLNKVNEIIGSLDQKGIEHMNIGEFSHSNIEQFRMELKAKALIAAKEKANFLLKAIDEQIGEVIEIQEIYDGYPPPMPMYEMRSMQKMDMAESASGPEIDFRKIKLKYEIKAVFAIKD